MNDELFLVEDEPVKEKPIGHKILVVDDEESVHLITNTALEHKLFDDKRVQIITAMSAKEAKEILNQHDDIALALIDVVMETPNAGLELVEYIRKILKNHMIRLVLRTGQPSQAPEEHVINFYDINDYKEKTELTAQKLYTLVRTSLRQFEQYQELQQSKEDIYKKMTTSELTGLPNRMKLNEFLDTQGEKTLVLINIDNFSTINETQGFEIGDKVIKTFSEYICDMYKDKMKVFHLQGDLFALLCFKSNDYETQLCISGIKAGIANHKFVIDSRKFYITASVGIALLEKGNLIQKAEMAIKEARDIGKNHTQIYTDDLNIIRTIHNNSLWAERLHLAIEDKRIITFFQPIYNLRTNKIEDYEALVRMRYKDEIYTPFHFLEAAMYSGQIYDIFKIVFNDVCKKAKETTYGFSINVSESDLREDDFFDYIKQTLKNYDINASRITLEILEYRSISYEKKIKELINKLHDYGLKISIDDFGSHCSNFAQLNNLKIDFIKIDGNFIKDIIKNKDSQIISCTIIDYAHQKDIPVIAEFVCEEDIYEYVKKIGADYAQGYFISEPKEELSEQNNLEK